MDLRQLEAFAAVMSAGSVTGAGQMLGRSQPTITRLIQELEQELGFALFERSGPKVTPTHKAFMMTAEVESALQGVRHVRQRAVNIARDENLSLRLVATPALAAGLLPPALARLPQALRPAWMVLGASSVLYSVSVLPVRRWSFLATMLVTWVNLNPFQVPDMHLFELRGSMFVCYAVFLNGLTLYSYLKMRRAKLYNFYMAKLLLEQAYVDALTEIPNRRSFMAKAEKHLQQDAAATRYLAMIDIDNFKKVNDQFGHDIGDVVLKRIAADIKASMSEFEYARLGGEEFVIYVWGLNQADAERRIDALCRRVRDEVAEHPVTISIGLAQILAEDTLSNALVKADQALYEAKRSGKDRYVLWREPLGL